jgi:DNA-binding GntR family transcriptional regulator
MRAKTDITMNALGDEDGFKLVDVLIKRGPQPQSALAKLAAVSPRRAGEQLRLLQALGLVDREPATRGRWSVIDASRVSAVYAAAAQLNVAISQARAKADEKDLERWRELASGGGESDE